MSFLKRSHFPPWTYLIRIFGCGLQAHNKLELQFWGEEISETFQGPLWRKEDVSASLMVLIMWRVAQEDSEGVGSESWDDEQSTYTKQINIFYIYIFLIYNIFIHTHTYIRTHEYMHTELRNWRLCLALFLFIAFIYFYWIFVCFFGLLYVSWGILIPLPGIEPTPSSVEVQSVNHWTIREAPVQNI